MYQPGALRSDIWYPNFKVITHKIKLAAGDDVNDTLVTNARGMTLSTFHAQTAK